MAGPRDARSLRHHTEEGHLLRKSTSWGYYTIQKLALWFMLWSIGDSNLDIIPLTWRHTRPRT